MERVLITDLTQMTGNRLCIAGVNERLGCVRLDIKYPGVQKNHLYVNNRSIIRPRAVISVDIKPKQNCVIPHVEDHQWLNPHQTRVEKVLEYSRWYKILNALKFESVTHIFEYPLKDNRIIEPRVGVRSLGTIKPKYVAHFHYLEDKHHPSGYRCRLSFRDNDDQYYAMIPVVDLAVIYYANYLNFNKHMTIDEIEKLMWKLIRSKGEVWLRLGLTRPWRGDDGKLWSYLQVTGIYTSPDYLQGKCFADFDY
ncbi:MAG: hypothetical protein K8I82_12670 [Anaerolineae bacterium]|nr:hypothetical protein [Anaerolineae bacterium]